MTAYERNDLENIDLLLFNLVKGIFNSTSMSVFINFAGFPVLEEHP